jgi:hypothetical protein
VSATDQKGRLLHPISQLVTWELKEELKELREQLEETLAKPDLPSYVRPRSELQADLDAVIKEQQERAIAERKSRLKAQQADA